MGLDGYGGGEGGGAVLEADGEANADVAGHVGAVPLRVPDLGGSGSSIGSISGSSSSGVSSCILYYAA